MFQYGKLYISCPQKIMYVTIEIYVINRIIPSTSLSPYSVEYESGKTTKYEHIVKKLCANPSPGPHFDASVPICNIGHPL